MVSSAPALIAQLSDPSIAVKPQALAAVGDSIYQHCLSFFGEERVDEVLINAASGLWLVRGPRLDGPHPSPFTAAASMTAWLQDLARRVGVRLDPLVGAAGGCLPAPWQHVRWHCVLPALTPDGPLLSLRRHRFTQLSLADFAGGEAAKEALVLAARRRDNLLIVGPTGAGKTSLLACLLSSFAGAERMVLVESTPELPLPTPASCRLLERQANLEGVGAVGMARLVREALRLRPDRLVVGEIRGHEAAAFIEVMLCGHQGAMTTLHASGAADATARLRHLAQAAGWVASTLGGTSVALTVVVMERGEVPVISQVTTTQLYVA